MPSNPLGIPGGTRHWRIAPDLLDPARRCCDAMNAAMHAGVPGFVAIRLSDGGSDGKVYEAWEDAKRFQLHPDQCMYLAVQPLPIPLPDAARLIGMHREMYATGLRPTNPEKGKRNG